MSIDWTKPLVVAGTDRVATVIKHNCLKNEYLILADWWGDGGSHRFWYNANTTAVTNAPHTPKIGPEHIEALAEAESLLMAAEDCPTIARLAEIRAYLESL